VKPLVAAADPLVYEDEDANAKEVGEVDIDGYLLDEEESKKRYRRFLFLQFF
jgi:hypothetical protein